MLIYVVMVRLYGEGGAGGIRRHRFTLQVPPLQICPSFGRNRRPCQPDPPPPLLGCSFICAPNWLGGGGQLTLYPSVIPPLLLLARLNFITKYFWTIRIGGQVQIASCFSSVEQSLIIVHIQINI